MAKEQQKPPATRGRRKPKDTSANGDGDPAAALEKLREETGEGEGAPPEGGEQLNGLLIQRTFDEQGNLNVGVQAVGDCKMTELPTILDIARKQVRAQMGLD